MWSTWVSGTRLNSASLPRSCVRGPFHLPGSSNAVPVGREPDLRKGAWEACPAAQLARLRGVLLLCCSKPAGHARRLRSNHQIGPSCCLLQTPTLA